MLCENILFLKILNFFNLAMTVLRFGIPIVLIVKLVIDIYKRIIDVNDSTFKEKVIQRIVACIIIFLVPTVVGVFLNFLETVTSSSFNYSECNYNIQNIALLEEQQELEEKLRVEAESSENYAKYQQRLKEVTETVKKNAENYQDISSGDGELSVRIGEKYNLSDSQLTNVAKVCQREQSTPEGAAAEAELMINKYLIEVADGDYKGTFYNYLFNSGFGKWWHPIKKGDYASTNLRPEIKEAVRKVVNEGQRKLPPYINEHDYIGDIKSITTNGVKGDKNKRSDYVKDQTHVHTTYNSGSTHDYWIFYCFPNVYKDKPNKTGDPFGYTYDAKEKIAKLNK